MRVQFVSDLHLEWIPGNFVGIKPIGDILILAGDIVPGSAPREMEKFRQFLTHYSPHYFKIIHVPGNHEYWSDDVRRGAIPMQNINGMFSHLENEFPKYKFIPRGDIQIRCGEKKYTILCSTLWTEIPPDQQKAIKSHMHDYDMIWIKAAAGIRKLLPKDVARIHKAHLKFIVTKLSSIPRGNTVILVTHHKPTSDLGRGVAYETDLVGKIIGPPVKLAIHGHTHVLYDKVINGTRVVSNPKGYHGRQRTGFVQDWVIDV